MPGCVVDTLGEGGGFPFCGDGRLGSWADPWRGGGDNQLLCCVALRLPTYTAKKILWYLCSNGRCRITDASSPKVRASSKVPLWPVQTVRLDYNILN